MNARNDQGCENSCVVFILANGLSNGGVTTWALNACHRLIRKNFDCRIIAHKPESGSQEFSRDSDLPILDCPINASGTPLRQHELEAIAQCYASIPHAVLLPNWSWGTWASVAYRYRHKENDSRVIGIAHTDEESYYAIMSYYQSIISKFIAVSNRTYAELLRRLPERHADIIRLSYPTTGTGGTARPAEAIKVLPIGYAGRIQEYQKRITDLKSLAARLAEQPGRYRIEVAGDGTHLQELRDHFARVRFPNVEVVLHGLVAADAMPAFWSRMDVAILFSSHEGLSISMIESMAAGCVQIVTDVSGVSDSVQDNVSGFVHQIGDTESMAHHLSLLLADPELRHRMSQACIDHVAQHHNPELYDQSLLQLAHSAWQQAPRSWPRWKRCIPRSVIAEYRQRTKKRQQISWKGRVKLKLIRLRNRLVGGISP